PQEINMAPEARLLMNFCRIEQLERRIYGPIHEFHTTKEVHRTMHRVWGLMMNTTYVMTNRICNLLYLAANTRKLTRKPVYYFGFGQWTYYDTNGGAAYNRPLPFRGGFHTQRLN